MLFFAEFQGFSQEFQLLQGQLISDSTSTANIHIVNLALEKGTTSDASGKFEIYANTGDRILFSSVQFENREIIITQAHLASGKIIVKLWPVRNELDEVRLSDIKLSGYLDADLPKIKYFDRDTYGIPHPEKRPTQTERRLYTANAGIESRWQYIGVLLGGVPLDVVLNDINGRTEYLRNLDKQDKLRVRVHHAIELLGRSFFVKEFGLPETEIENFVYYCARKSEFQNILESKNTLNLIEYFRNNKEDFINLRQLNDFIEE